MLIVLLLLEVYFKDTNITWNSQFTDSNHSMLTFKMNFIGQQTYLILRCDFSWSITDPITFLFSLVFFLLFTIFPFKALLHHAPQYFLKTWDWIGPLFFRAYCFVCHPGPLSSISLSQTNADVCIYMPSCSHCFTFGYPPPEIYY